MGPCSDGTVPYHRGFWRPKMCHGATYLSQFAHVDTQVTGLFDCNSGILENHLVPEPIRLQAGLERVDLDDYFLLKVSTLASNIVATKIPNKLRGTATQNRFCVPAVCHSFQQNGQEFQPEASLKERRVSFAMLACLYVIVVSLSFKTRTRLRSEVAPYCQRTTVPTYACLAFKKRAFDRSCGLLNPRVGKLVVLVRVETAD